MRAFLKMHGLGNDFVVVDARSVPFTPDAVATRAIADRRTGVGCDQLIVLEPSATPGADLFMRILNADGSEVGACGNATRCVASLVMGETGRDHATIETVAGLLEARAAASGTVSVDMGPALTDWQAIPLARPMDTAHLALALGPLADPVAVSVGNPHAVFFVPDAEAVDLTALGPVLEHDPLFPERANIEVAQILSSGRIRMRVWERGVGITNACGSGACATLVAAARRGLTGRSAEIVLDGGSLTIEWTDQGRVIMTGPASLAFRGELADDLYPGAASGRKTPEAASGRKTVAA